MADLEKLLFLLPPPWSYGVQPDGRIFFINDKTHTTTWLEPNTQEPLQTGNRPLKDLPRGWEEGVTTESVPYFIDHNERRTTFNHPKTGKPVIPEAGVQLVNSRSPENLNSSGSSLSPLSSPTSPTSPSPGGPHHMDRPRVHVVHKTVPKSASLQIRRRRGEQVTIQGWLNKLDGSGLRQWKRRWCLISNFCLFYYKGSDEENNLGSVLLPSYSIVTTTPLDKGHRKFGFKLEHDNMRTYTFSADTYQDMDMWIKALRLASVLKRHPNELDSDTKQPSPVGDSGHRRAPDDAGFKSSRPHPRALSPRDQPDSSSAPGDRPNNYYQDRGLSPHGPANGRSPAAYGGSPGANGGGGRDGTPGSDGGRRDYSTLGHAERRKQDYATPDQWKQPRSHASSHSSNSLPRQPQPHSAKQRPPSGGYYTLPRNRAQSSPPSQGGQGSSADTASMQRQESMRSLAEWMERKRSGSQGTSPATANYVPASYEEEYRQQEEEWRRLQEFQQQGQRRHSQPEVFRFPSVSGGGPAPLQQEVVPSPEQRSFLQSPLAPSTQREQRSIIQSPFPSNNPKVPLQAQKPVDSYARAQREMTARQEMRQPSSSMLSFGSSGRNTSQNDSRQQQGGGIHKTSTPIDHVDIAPSQRNERRITETPIQKRAQPSGQQSAPPPNNSRRPPGHRDTLDSLPPQSAYMKKRPQKALHMSNGHNLRFSISAADLLGKTHEELTLLLIELRRKYAELEDMVGFLKRHLDSEQKRLSALRDRSESGFYSPEESNYMEEEEEQVEEMRLQCGELERQLDVSRPLINLVDNLVKMGSLYGGENEMLAQQLYRDRIKGMDFKYSPPKKLIEFSRKLQEDKLARDYEEERRLLDTTGSSDMIIEEKMQRLHDLHRESQERSNYVMGLREDKDKLEAALALISKQMEKYRDSPNELLEFEKQQQRLDQELTRIRAFLAQGTGELEEVSMETSKLEHEVSMIRTKMQEDVNRSSRSPSEDSMKAKVKLEQELSLVQSVMDGLSKQREDLELQMKSLKETSPAKSPSKKRVEPTHTSYLVTDLDTMKSSDISHSLSGNSMESLSSPRSPPLLVENQGYQKTQQAVDAEVARKTDGSSVLQSSVAVVNMPPQYYQQPPVSSTVAQPQYYQQQQQQQQQQPVAKAQQSRYYQPPAFSVMSQPNNYEQPPPYVSRPASSPALSASPAAAGAVSARPQPSPVNKQTVRNVKRESERRTRQKDRRRVMEDLTPMGSEDSEDSLLQGGPPRGAPQGGRDGNQQPDRRHTISGLGSPKWEPDIVASTGSKVAAAAMAAGGPDGQQPLRRARSLGRVEGEAPPPVGHNGYNNGGGWQDQGRFGGSGYDGANRERDSQKIMGSTPGQPPKKATNGLRATDQSKPRVRAKSASERLNRGSRSQTLPDGLGIELPKVRPLARVKDDIDISSLEKAMKSIEGYDEDLPSPGFDDSVENMPSSPDYVRAADSTGIERDEPSGTGGLLGIPAKIKIPERYIPDDEEDKEMSLEEREKHDKRVENIKKMLSTYSMQDWYKKDPADQVTQVKKSVKAEKARREQMLSLKADLAREVKQHSKDMAAQNKPGLMDRESSGLSPNRSPLQWHGSSVDGGRVEPVMF